MGIDAGALGGDIPSGAPRHLLTLRFHDRDLERAFQAEAGARFRLQIQFTIILGAATWAAAGLLIPLAYPVDPVRIGGAIASIEVLIIVLLGFMGRGRSWDFEQTISGLVNLIGGPPSSLSGASSCHCTKC